MDEKRYSAISRNQPTALNILRPNLRACKWTYEAFSGTCVSLRYRLKGNGGKRIYQMKRISHRTSNVGLQKWQLSTLHLPWCFKSEPVGCRHTVYCRRSTWTTLKTPKTTSCTVSVPSRACPGTHLRCPPFGKEACVIIATIDRMLCVLDTQDIFDNYTDQHSLIFLLNPLSVAPNVLKPTFQTVCDGGWNYTFIVTNASTLNGPDHLGWSDWGKENPQTICRLMCSPMLPLYSCDEFKWLQLSNIAGKQQKYPDWRLSNMRLDDQLWTDSSGRVWIPDDSFKLQLRLCTIAHTRPSGHQGWEFTVSTFCKSFSYIPLLSQTSAFMEACVHCITTNCRRRYCISLDQLFTAQWRVISYSLTPHCTKQNWQKIHTDIARGSL